MQLKLGWWNTSLSPTKGRGSTTGHRKFAIGMVRHLLDSGLDMLGLCEVSLADVKALEDEFGPRGFGVIYVLNSVGRSRFDMALIYRLSTVSCTVLSPWTSSFGKRTYRISCPVEVTVNGESLLLVLAHWPSRMFYPRGDAHRHRIAVDMRVRLDALFDSGRRDIIIMGDFNDEPFDQNIASMLLALRDRTSAAANAKYLYNPFWNFLGSRPFHDGDTTEPSWSGTYRYAKDDAELWWTFDQIMFSSSFVSTGNWQLQEHETAIIRNPSLVEKVVAKGKFDHLPIVSAIKRVTKNG